MGVEFLTQRDRALFGVWAVCKPANAEKVKQIIQEELARLNTEPVSGHDLAVAKRLTTAAYILSNQTPADRATTLTFYDALGNYREAKQYLARVRAITAQDIKRVAQWYAGTPVWVTLAPQEGKP